MAGGSTGPAIYGDSVLFLDREGDTRDVLRRVRLADGKEVWRFSYRAAGKLYSQGSRTTPATDGRFVLVVGPLGHVHMVRFADGKPVWKAHILDDWDVGRPNWGVWQSPLFLGDIAILAPWGKSAAVVAYEKATGKVIWTSPNPGGTEQGYSSPVAATVDGRSVVVASGLDGKTIGVDAETGKRLWSYAGYTCNIHIPTPRIMEDGRILLTGGYDAGTAMCRVESTDGQFRAEELWQNRSVGSRICPPSIYRGHIYCNSSDRGRGLCCVARDGVVKWQTRNNPGFGMGSMLVADGLIFIIDGASGQLVMAEAGPEGYNELARAPILTGKQVGGPMAYHDGKLVLRGRKSLVCIDLEGSAPLTPRQELKQWLDRCQKAYDRLQDYTCIFVQRERVDNELLPEERARLKFKKPFKVYMKWVGKVKKGQECLYVRGRYDNELVARGTGLASLITVTLDPTGSTAMRGRRHPITEAGIGHLLKLLREDYRLAARHGEGRVIDRGTDRLSGRELRVLECILPADRRPQYYSHRAVVSFDTELRLPVRVSIYDGRGRLLEHYCYRDLKVDAGLTEKDFDRDNPEYGF